MRNIYIVLAGLVTAAAVLGWSGREVQTEPVPVVDVPAPVEVDVAQHKPTVSAVSKEDTSLRAAIDAAANDARVKAGVKPVVSSDFRLLGPDVAPSLDASSNVIQMPDYKAVLELLVENAQLASRSVAIADLSRATILASKDSSWLLSLMKDLSDVSGEKLVVSDGRLGRLAWKCLEETREHCIIGYAPMEAAIKNACEIAHTTFVSFDGKPVDTAELFGAENCKQEAGYEALAKSLAAVPDEKGKVEAGGVSYQFERSKLENGIEIVSVLELVPEVPENVPKDEIKAAGCMGYSYPVLGIAAFSGIVMVLLGVFCTRRRDRKPLPEPENQNAKVEAGESDEKAKAIKRENDALKAEAEALKKKAADLEAQVSQISEALKASRSELEHEQISRMSLAEENRRLEDSIASGDGKERTLVDTPANIAALPDPIEKLLEESIMPDKDENKPAADNAKPADAGKAESAADKSEHAVAKDDNDSKAAKQPNRPALPKLGSLKVGTVSTAPKQDSASKAKANGASAAKTDAKPASRTAAKPDAKPAENADKKSGRAKGKDTAEISDPNRITAQIDASINPVSSKENSQAFFESFSDEGWDEISESFDELFKNGSVFNESKVSGDKKSRSKKRSDVFPEDHSSMRDTSLGMSSFFEAVNKAEESGGRKTPSTVIVKKASATGNTEQANEEGTATGSSSGLISMPRSLLESGRSRQATIRSAGPSLHTTTLIGTGTVTTDKPHTTFNGLAAISKATIEDVPEMPKKEGLQMITPWREGVDKKHDSGMDQNSLYDALKRRAKDVSEIEATSADGSLEYNRGLSRSGVFSVTGSRVDIDPLSDSEYFKALHAEYVETQKKCGDTSEQMTLEQFVSKLAREKERIMKTYKCQNVRFQVYVKNGKASVMAKPQK